MSEDRKLMIRAKTVAAEALVRSPDKETARMVALAIADLCVALTAALDRGLRAEAEIHRLCKELELVEENQ